jgi:4'-phosphopantetheinyl transferase
MSHDEHSNPSDIQLYVCDLRYVEPRIEVLSADERARAVRYPSGRRNAFVRSRTVLRELLGRSLDVPPESLSLTVKDGKPRLDLHVDLQFSFSHSEDLAVVAMAHGMDVGVDVERIRDDVGPNKIGAAIFEKDEVEALSEGADFFELWTRKEASFKILRRGTARYFWTGRPVPGYVVSIAAEEKFRVHLER